ncbi:MAG: LacI family transcriptional regulator [Sphingomonadales bacterium]|nr:LacI family transcriptional regulator [Sphingomonadales bacterium]
MRSATIRDVARAAKVSTATVSRVLNRSETVAEPTVSRVLKVANELDYVPHGGARSLASKRTDTIGVLLPDLHGEFFSELIRGIDAGTSAHGLHLLLSRSHGDPQEAAAVLRAMRSRVDAMLVMSPYADGEELSSALKGGVPLVLLNSSGGVGGRHPTFAIDNHAGAFAITAHLIETGRRRIAFIAGPADNIEAAERLRGYRAALAAAGQSVEQIAQGDFTEQSGVAAARQLLRTARPDAIFAANDMMAIGCLQALREAELRVPGNVAVAGFDDIPVARFVEPALTTAGVPIAEIGRQALECCVAIIRGADAGDHNRIFTPQLVIRASSTDNSEHRPQSLASERI